VPLAIPEAVLRAQLEYLRRRGYVGLTLTDAERRRCNGTLPSRSVVVTFDDGYASTSHAAPILAEVGFPGTVFVVTDFVESGEPLSWAGIDHLRSSDTVHELRPLSWEQVETLAGAGWEIGSHTTTHPLLTRVDDGRLREELELSRAAIERRIGSCVSLAYPYGLADERVAAAAKAAGYEVACMLTFAHVVDEPFRRPRVGMGSTDTGLRLRFQVSGLGQAARRSALVRLARRLRRRRAWLPGS
jgi:peptidoglycan/xylan/chitin deacetylase (PgdA/CDA1 family)